MELRILQENVTGNLLVDMEGHTEESETSADVELNGLGEDQLCTGGHQTAETNSQHRQRAQQLLLTGGMPLFPPGRRNWDNVGPTKVSEKPTPMFWPPNNWTTLSPEEKLTAWRFAAFTLD